MRRAAFTLLELAVVLVVLAALAALIVPLIGSTPADCCREVTAHNMALTRDAILGHYRSHMKDDILEQFRMENPGSGVALPLTIPRTHFTGSVSSPNLKYLFVNPGIPVRDPTQTNFRNLAVLSFDPACRRGWNGPYLTPSLAGTYKVEVGRGFTTAFADHGDPAVLDGWANPIVIAETNLNDVPGAAHWKVVLISAGPDGVLGNDDDITLLVEDRIERRTP